MGGGFCPLTPFTGATPLDPECFWIEDPSRIRLALDGISAINPNRFYCWFYFIYFYLQISFEKRKRLLKSSETYAQKAFLNSEKKIYDKKKFRKIFQH